MRVYAVIGYDNYYPCPDNVIGPLYTNYNQAEEALEQAKENGRRDFYDIIEYEVE